MLAGKSKAMWERGSFKGMDDLFAGTSLAEGRGNTPARMGKFSTEKFEGVGPEEIGPLYHGTFNNVEGDLRPSSMRGVPEPRGISLTRDLATAHDFAGYHPEMSTPGATIFPKYARGPVMDDAEFQRLIRRHEASGKPHEEAKELAQADAEARGFTGVDLGGDFAEVSIFRPDSLRAPWAKFGDPSKKDSSDLLAILALASMAGGGGLLSRAARENHAPY